MFGNTSSSGFIPDSFVPMTAFVRNAQKMSGVTTLFLLTMPFDAMREQYALAVRVGLLKSSLLASSRFGRLVSDLEHCALGPMARQA